MRFVTALLHSRYGFVALQNIPHLQCTKKQGPVVRFNQRILNPAFAASDQATGVGRAADDSSSRRPRDGGIPLKSEAPGFSTLGLISFLCRRCAGSAARVAEWHRRARSRCELMALGERELSDMRVTRCDALYEASKPFWKE
jgi:uncharacterized protein YjiS (DUF1127 family)